MSYYYVISPNEAQFRLWMLQKKVKLQDCKYLCSVEAVEAVANSGFTNPERELVLLVQWSDNKTKSFLDAIRRIVSVYCRDRRVHEVPTEYVV